MTTGKRKAASTPKRSWWTVQGSLPDLALLTLLCGACIGSAGHPVAPTAARTVGLDFHRGPQGFTAGFAGSRPGDAERLGLRSGHRALPAPLEGRAALFISGDNFPGGDLFMFVKGPLGGLRPGARYGVTVNLEIATNTPAGCVGAGGPPGESVWIKAGAAAVEPRAVGDGSYLRMNIDVGIQSRGSAQAVVLGDMTNSRRCEQPRRWERKSLPGRTTPVPVTAPPDGRVWLWFGVDSGFAGRTAVYFTQASVTFAPL